ncbi:hypothetical protein [Nitrospira sp. BLG_2]|uniref:hypothetical protein n=1 Tax=Nitrospira sp. BLG_2 TaxID=3397507 RepID=UPI003B9D0372
MMRSLRRCGPPTVILWIGGVLIVGCASIMTLDYEPGNSLKGQGKLTIEPFRYEAAGSGRVRAHEVERNQGTRAHLFLSQEVSTFFTEALRKELAHSGYTVEKSGTRSISGSLARFYVDWTDETKRWFELRATYNVRSGDRTVFTWNCFSVQYGPNLLAQSGVLIRRGTEDCMQRFIQAAQDAQALQ